MVGSTTDCHAETVVERQISLIAVCHLSDLGSMTMKPIAETEQNPWTVRRRKVVYCNPWIKVEHCDVLDPSGNEGIYGIVHYLNRTVVVLAIDDQGYICLVGQYRLPHRGYAWELPGGTTDPDEEPLTAARRELREETGFEAIAWLSLPALHPSNGVTDEVVVPFIAWTLRKVASVPEEATTIRVEWLPFPEGVSRVQDGRIHDAATVATILRAGLMAAKGELPCVLVSSSG